MAKYLPKPVAIDAERVSMLLYHAGHSWKKLPTWVADAYDAGDLIFLRDSVDVQTPEGRLIGASGDLLICGAGGEIRPCKPEIFAKTYELAD